MDKDPSWRSTAIFTRAELEQLISDERIAPDRRVVYALCGLAALRHGEAAGLTWSHYDGTLKPLGRLVVANSYQKKGTKTNVTREMPVHPTLAKILAEWKLGGWEAHYGRAPKADDLIVPTRRDEMRNVRQKKDSSTARKRDLKLLGLRKRRGHDLRRTFISIAQDDGALPHILERATHGPRGDILNQYTTLAWGTFAPRSPSSAYRVLMAS